MKIRSFSLRSLLMFIVLVTVFMFATTAAMADKGSRLSDKSVVALKALDVGGPRSPLAVGAISLIPKGDGVFVAAGVLATNPHGKGKKATYLTSIIPLTRGDTIGHYMITNSRPNLITLGDRAHRTGFILRC